MDRKNSVLMSMGSISIVMIMAACLVSLRGCGFGREMIALASQDAGVRQFFGLPDKPITFRKELLLPASIGKDQDQNEDFIGIWRDDTKAGRVYYVIKKPLIHRTGYQSSGETFISSPGPTVDMQTINKSGSKTTLMDGKEFQ